MASLLPQIQAIKKAGVRGQFFWRDEPDPYMAEVVRIKGGVLTLRCYARGSTESWGEVDLLAKDITRVCRHRELLREHLERSAAKTLGER